MAHRVDIDVRDKLWLHHMHFVCTVCVLLMICINALEIVLQNNYNNDCSCIRTVEHSVAVREGMKYALSQHYVSSSTL